MADVVLRGRFEAAHARRYTYLPFDVPSGVQRLDVTYDYSDRIAADPRLGGGNTLDIGLFDARGTGLSSPGFRGCSGSDKLAFTLTSTWATPPYIPGPLPAGTWHVLLGPYKVGPRGCEYEVRISFGHDPELGRPARRPMHVDVAPPRLAAAAEPGWLRGDLHCHTLYSDGDSWPAEMLAEAVRRGLEFLGVTDHNQTGHQADYARVTGAHLPILLPGLEVTTYGGHWNAWGTSTCWDFLTPTEAAVTREMQQAAMRGAVVSVNHPIPFGPPWEYPDAVGYHAVEVWNGPFERGNAAAVAFWERQLRAGRHIAALGGSDTHRLKSDDVQHRLGVPTTWAQVGTDRSAAGVLAALRSGHAFISHDVAGPQLYLSCAEEDTTAAGSRPDAVRIRAVDARGAVLAVLSERGLERELHVAADDWSDTLRIAPPCAYVRAQLTASSGQMLALTNALFAPR